VTWVGNVEEPGRSGEVVVGDIGGEDGKRGVAFCLCFFAKKYRRWNPVFYCVFTVLGPVFDPPFWRGFLKGNPMTRIL
jgi:hypothetical protein